MPHFFQKILSRILKALYALTSRTVWIWPKYRIAGCINREHRSLLEFKWPFLLKGTLESRLQDFLLKIDQQLKSQKKFSVIRLGDGEALFLKGFHHGNIAKRHFVKPVNDLEEWSASFKKNDLLCFSTILSLRRHWLSIFPHLRKDFFPIEVIYGAIASRRLFHILRGFRIGLVGAKEKLEIISLLMERTEYQDYLGIDSFSSLIPIEQTGAGSETEQILKKILISHRTSPCDLYLVGMGIAKLKVLSEARDQTNSIFIDIGSGLDAIAGLIPNDRPYFADWINFRLEGLDISKIDFLSQFNPHVVEKKKVIR